MKIETAMILAAGLGTRMRPLTLTTPKPLVEICGKPMLLRNLEMLHKAGVKKVVINIHYLGEKIADYIAVQNFDGMEILISDESEKLLDSAGGIIKALPLLGEKPFFVMNSDSFWVDQDQSNLLRLADFFHRDKMDIAMLVVPRLAAPSNERGDFLINAQARLSRAPAFVDHSVIYPGCFILNPQILERDNLEPHSLNHYFDKAIAKDRLYGLLLQGDWYTAGTMDMIDVVEELMKDRHQT